MERISAFMDGELESTEAAAQIGRLKQEANLRETWETYHLIGDALRGEARMSRGLTARICVRLREEPTMLAPRSLPTIRSVRRLALPIAASVGGAALVAWLALFNNPLSGPAPGSGPLAQKGAGPAQGTAVAAPAKGAMNDYLLAHQQFSPSTTMQGVASYIRTVSTQDADGR
jgi:sigma-E factor negative regulatory protein RseA